MYLKKKICVGFSYKGVLFYNANKVIPGFLKLDKVNKFSSILRCRDALFRPIKELSNLYPYA